MRRPLSPTIARYRREAGLEPILLIGQAPGPNSDPDLPLYPLPAGKSGGRLAAYMGIDYSEYLMRFDRANLLYEHPGRHRSNDYFPDRLARVAAEAMLQVLEGRRLVALGRETGDALGYPLLGYHSWTRCPRWGVRIAVAPHPSGRSRWYNDEGNQREARQFWLSTFAEQCAWLPKPLPEDTEAA